MANGIVTWFLKNTVDGSGDYRNFTSREEAEAAAAEKNAEYPYHEYVPSTAHFFLDGSPFHIALFEKQETTPVERQGDGLDIAEYVDATIKTLFDTNKMDTNALDACHKMLLSLHGSTYANEWYDAVWFDYAVDSWKPTARKQYTIVAFTRHELTIRADSPADARELFKDKLTENIHIAADRSNTVFDTLPTD